MYGLALNALILLVVLAALVWLGFKARRLWRGVPQRAAKPLRAARIAEAVSIMLMGGSILALGTLGRFIPSPLYGSEEAHPILANVVLATIACVACLIAAGAVLAFRGRTLAGLCVAAGALLAFALFINGPGQPMLAVAEAFGATPKVTYTIDLSNTNAEGADLWVNDVYLGKTPVKMSLEEFQRKVPFRDLPPEPAFCDLPESELVKLPEYTPNGENSQTLTRNLRLSAPYPGEFDSFYELRKGRSAEYTARVKYAGEDGLGPGNRGMGGGGGIYSMSYVANVGVRFPEREARLERLLDQARALDYRVGPDWFQTLETYGADAWLALNRLALEEPGMAQVFDAWATWRYGLDEASAWQSLEHIRADADERNQYFTSSVAGRAIELIAPKLDSERLVALAESLLQRRDGYGWSWWDTDTGFEFGLALNATNISAGAGTYSYTGGAIGSDSVRPSDVAVAHAVMLLEQRLDERNPAAETIVEERIGPLLIQRAYQNGRWHDQPLELAAKIGGPQVARFLDRQPWHREIRDNDWARNPGLVMYHHGNNINRWLYLLTILSGPEGQDFRKRHWQHVEASVDRLIDASHVYTTGWDHRIQPVLFHDLELSESSTAYRYWPRFLERAPKGDDSALRATWTYLSKMEPLSTPEMYVEAARQHRNVDRFFTLPTYELQKLPSEKRAAVINTLLADFEASDENTDAAIMLRQVLINDYPSEWVLEKLREKSSQVTPENVALWLAHEAPDHPVVPVLADQPDPQLRKLVLGALEAQPIPQNRAILDKLLNDPDPEVRAGAEKVRDALAILAATPPAQFASDPTAEG